MAKKKWLRWIIPVLVIVAAYFINVEVQSYLGRKAVAATDLTMHSLEEAKNLAAKSDKLVLADLSAIWCPSCRSFDKRVLSDAQVQAAIDEKYVFARIEYESDAGVAFRERFKVNGFPRLFVLDSNGDLVRELKVSFQPDTFRQQL